MISSAALERINQAVWRQYPEFSGVRPAVTERPGSKAALPMKDGAGPAFTCTYQAKVAVAGGKSIARWVRVSLNANGDILKISSSK